MKVVCLLTCSMFVINLNGPAATIRGAFSQHLFSLLTRLLSYLLPEKMLNSRSFNASASHLGWIDNRSLLCFFGLLEVQSQYFTLWVSAPAGGRTQWAAQYSSAGTQTVLRMGWKMLAELTWTNTSQDFLVYVYCVFPLLSAKADLISLGWGVVCLARWSPDHCRLKDYVCNL